MNSRQKAFFRSIPFSSLPIMLFKALKKQWKHRNERKILHCMARLSPLEKKIFYFGATQRNNMGDLAQALCIRKWLKENYPERSVFEVPDSVIVNPDYHFSQHLKKVLNPDDLIFFQSGYNTQDIGGDQETMHRIICDNFPDAKIVFMPQTVLFLKAENRLRTARSYDGCRHALFLARDAYSAKTAQEMFHHIPVISYPDIVTTLIGQYRFDIPRDGIFFCVRNDLEKLYSEEQLHECAETLMRFHHLPVVFGDTDMDMDHGSLVRQFPRLLDDMLKKFAGYRLIITDRYHGTIFSLIANTPVIVIPSNDHKVTTGVDWFKGVYDDRVVLAKNLQDVPKIAATILAMPPQSPPEPHFKERYYDQLKECITRCTQG